MTFFEHIHQELVRHGDQPEPLDLTDPEHRLFHAASTRELLLAILIGVHHMAGTFDQFKQDLDAIKAGVLAQNQKLKDLSAQVAAGTPVTQEQLDGAIAESESVINALQTGATSDAPPADNLTPPADATGTGSTTV